MAAFLHGGRFFYGLEVLVIIGKLKSSTEAVMSFFCASTGLPMASAMGGIGRASGSTFAPDQTATVRRFIAMGLGLVMVLGLWLHQRKASKRPKRQGLKAFLQALLTDLTLKPVAALQIMRGLNAVALWCFWSYLLLQISEVISLLFVRGAFNRDALSWCFLSTGIGLVLLSCLRSLLEVGRSIIVLEQRSRQQRGDAMHN